MLDLLRPQLAKMYASAQLRRVAHEALAFLERTEAPLVVLEGADRIAYATPEAQRLLATYFRGGGTRLPHEVAEWLRERRRTSNPEPLAVERGEQSVVVHLVDGSLLLEEKRDASRLTSRESEIVDLLAAGKTNAEIAEILWIAPGTVRKHLENVYEKLGVHTRTAAVARALRPNLRGRLEPSSERHRGEGPRSYGPSLLSAMRPGQRLDSHSPRTAASELNARPAGL